ncbi:CLUMA_CG004943, isoform A [Clunio marinus]|uniref:poly(ADP-ribose) glycohydrolase n=1 Tax=Clunio marinus TaxID=568069 RepID=A0A1J1HT79_9DIPT|nr:CLUMA_CG004943, isoform A [Clunio marinus]
MIKTKNDEGSSTDSCDEKDKADDKSQLGCSHVTKSIESSKLRKVLKEKGILQKCSECEKLPVDDMCDDNMYEYDNALMLCLRCGTQLCGRRKNKHALRHYETPHSDSHALTINTATFQVWCYLCDNEVAENSSKKVLECAQLVKKTAQKPIIDQETAENKVRSVLESMTPLLYDDNNTTAENTKLRQASPSSIINSSLKFDSTVGHDSVSTEMLPRVRGLTNLGNTCFFNAMMQNLAQTPFLLEVLKDTSAPGEEFELPGGRIKSGDDELDLPKVIGELKEWGPFTQTLAETLEELQTKSGGVFTPRDVLRQFTSRWPQFAGGDQHDSHEALRHLLESVRSEDLRRFQSVILQKLGYNSKTDPSKVENDAKAKIKFYGNQAQERILQPEPVFRGFLVSTLTCQDCNNISPNQETFLDISLPVTTDKPHPPATRRKTSPEPLEKPLGPTKSQLKKEKRAERKAKRVTKNQSRKQPQSSPSNAIDDENKETENVSSPESESDADVEDSVTDDPLPRKIEVDANGNSTEMKSPQSPEKKDDMPENIFKGEDIASNVAYQATISNSGMANLSNNMSKVKIADDELIDEDEKQKAIKNQQILRQQQNRTRQISHADWSNTLGPRYQCPEGELSVQSCLNHFMSVEYMMGNNKVGCEACTERINGKNGKTVYTNATKQFLISSPPAVLILHLKRFQVGMRGMFRKITKHVEFPTILDLAPFCASKVKLLSHVRRHQKKLLYSLYGIVEHSGGMHGGHYIAYVKVRPKLGGKDHPRWDYLPKGTKAELDQIDEQKMELEKQAEKVKKRQMSTAKDSDDSLSSTSTSSSDDEEDAATGGSDEPSEEPPQGKWYYVSDSHVREVSEERIKQDYLMEEIEEKWVGTPITDIYGNYGIFERQNQAPVIEESDYHTVLFELPLPDDELEFPKPKEGKDEWNENFVRLPSSSESRYQEIDESGYSSEKLRWDLICKSLTENKIENSHDLEKAIKAYNTKYENQWDFSALHFTFEEIFLEEEAEFFFFEVMPEIIDLALRLPQLIKSSIPLLKQRKNHAISMSQEQAGCLMANAFLCTFPRRNIKRYMSDYPEINFNKLFNCGMKNNVAQKIKCICHYFKQICYVKMPTGVLTFQRRFIDSSELPSWEESNVKFSTINVNVSKEGTIEDGTGMLQVDFANRFLGGGVLSWGCVQEEIRSVINPEIIVGMLFCESMSSKDAILLTGCEQFSKCSGYSTTFEWAGNNVDTTQRDKFRRRMTYIVAIDAISYRKPHLQFEPFAITREANKAFVGFYHDPNDEVFPIPIASGNWGCGAFGGNKQIKSLIQLMACSVNQRNLVYFTFGEDEIMSEINEMFEFLKRNEITIGQIWKLLRKFKEKGMTNRPNLLYSFIYKHYNSNDDESGPGELKDEKTINEESEKRSENAFSEIEFSEETSSEDSNKQEEAQELHSDGPSMKKTKVDEDDQNEETFNQSNETLNAIAMPTNNKKITDFFKPK